MPGRGSCCDGPRCARTSLRCLARRSRRGTHCARWGALRSDNRGESDHEARYGAPAPGPSIAAAPEIAPAGHRPPRQPTVTARRTSLAHTVLQRRGRAGCGAHEDRAPAMTRLAPALAPSSSCSSQLSERSPLAQRVLRRGRKAGQRRFSRRPWRRPPCQRVAARPTATLPPRKLFACAPGKRAAARPTVTLPPSSRRESSGSRSFTNRGFHPVVFRKDAQFQMPLDLREPGRTQGGHDLFRAGAGLDGVPVVAPHRGGLLPA